MKSRGLALITVLWVLTLLSLIAASFSNSTRTEIKLAFNQSEAARAEALADAGVHTAILGLLAPDPANQWRADGTVYGWRRGGGEIRVQIWDEGGKIDINVATEVLLKALFVAAGQEPDDAAVLADRIVDFRDINDLRQLNGAEDRDYSDAGLPYGAKDAPFEALEELRQVLGVTQALYDSVAPALSVRARQRRPHEATAPPLVKAALAGEVLDRDPPAEPPEDAALDPDPTESGVAPIEPPLPGAEPPELDSPAPVRSRLNVLTIHAEGRMDTGSVFVRTAVVEVGAGGDVPFEFWAWKQGKRSLFPFIASTR
jgi:general secretion pathway protein K